MWQSWKSGLARVLARVLVLMLVYLINYLTYFMSRIRIEDFEVKGERYLELKRIVFTQLRVDGVLNHSAFLRGSLSICGERRTCYSVDEI